MKGFLVGLLCLSGIVAGIVALGYWCISEFVKILKDDDA